MAEPFTKPVEEVLQDLQVDPEHGLGRDEVQRRRKTYGANRLRRKGPKSAWAILIDQFRSLIFLLLAAAAGLSFLLSEPVQGAAIAVAMLLNAAIGFFTEWRAVRSMEALSRLERITARVRRGRQQRQVPAENLVPGDIVPLAAGDLVPADLRLIEAQNLHCDESSLTGESVPVGKSTEVLRGEPPLAERRNMAYKGTSVTRGSGLGVVVAIGEASELGKIAGLAEEAEAEETPLEQRLDQLARRLLVAIIVIAAITAAVGVLAGRDPRLMIETGIALVIAAVPEGLPIVASIALARGMWRLARRNALIEKLSAVETLGGTTVICTDKTGTLTENRMTLRQLALAEGDVKLEGGEEPRFSSDDSPLEVSEQPALLAGLEIGALCNTAELGETPEDAAGDPMEIALLAAAAAAGIAREDLIERQTEVRREEFDPAVKMMATFHRIDGKIRVAVKGAPESVIEASTKVLVGAEEKPLDEEGRERWRRRNEALARQGLRNLAVAQKSVAGEGESPYEELTLIGLLGLLDPPRSEVKEAIEACRAAGIKVVMVTGDQPATAQAIAEAVGLLDRGAEATVICGSDLKHAEEMSEEERKRALEASIFARLDPKQKLDLIRIHQENGARVAMTGDGVNDAPALKKADIGIAMGLRGTEVAREAAHMVLRDDSFATIVTAIAQGRVIFSNIRRFIVYMLSGNTGEIFAVALVALLNAPLPLLPLQILYINLISDVFPALALGVGGGKGTLDRPARDPEEPILTARHWGAIAAYGVLIGGSVLAVFAYSLLILGMEQQQAVTISFLTFATARLLHVLNMRDAGSGLLRNTVTLNPYVWGAIAFGALLLVAALEVPLLAQVLKIADPGATGWLLIAVGSIVPLIVGQIFKSPRVRSLLGPAVPR